MEARVLVKVIKQVVASQLQLFLDEKDYLDLFQSSFRPDFETETALVALISSPSTVVHPCWSSWNLSSIHHHQPLLLPGSAGKTVLGALLCSGFTPSYLTVPRWYAESHLFITLALTIWGAAGIYPISHDF